MKNNAHSCSILAAISQVIVMTLSGGSHAEGQTGLTSDGKEKSGTSFPAFFVFVISVIIFSYGHQGKPCLLTL